MDLLWAVLGGAVGLGLGVWVGLRWGANLRELPGWRYWLANGAAMVAGMALTFAGSVFGVVFIWVAGLGLMGGGLTGLKYGYGKSVGVWRTVDRITGVDDLPKG